MDNLLASLMGMISFASIAHDLMVKAMHQMCNTFKMRHVDNCALK